MSWNIETRRTNMVGYFDGKRQRAGYRGAIEPDLAPWSQLLGRVTSRFDLAEYPQDELREALATFAEGVGRAANPLMQSDWRAVEALILDVGRWQS